MVIPFQTDPSDSCNIRYLPPTPSSSTQIYPAVNNGVYRCGFATTQDAYDAVSRELHAALERINDILGTNRFLTGDRCELGGVGGMEG